MAQLPGHLEQKTSDVTICNWAFSGSGFVDCTRTYGIRFHGPRLGDRSEILWENDYPAGRLGSSGLR